MRISDWSSDVCSSDLGRPVKLVTGEDVEVAADGGDIDRHARHRLAAVEQKLRANAMGQIGGAAGVEDGAEDVGDVCEGDQLVALGEHGGHDVEVDAAILGQRNYVDFCARALGDELPGDDVDVELPQTGEAGCRGRGGPDV